jgi:hypothetical protein
MPLVTLPYTFLQSDYHVENQITIVTYYGKVDAVERIVLIYIMDIQQVKRAYSR